MQPIENERKFVVRNYVELEALLTPFGWVDITQGYLNSHNRIRIEKTLTTENCIFTYKQRLSNGHNLEINCPLDLDTGKATWEYTKERLTKRRVIIDYVNCEWDIDFYRWPHGKYFVIAEVEMSPDMNHPDSILPYIENHIAYTVPPDDGRFTARLLADEDYVRTVCAELKAAGIDL